MAKKAKKARPVAMAPAPKRYKDFMVMKYGIRGKSMAVIRRRWQAQRRPDRRFVFPQWIRLSHRQVFMAVDTKVICDEPPDKRAEGWVCSTINCRNNGFGPMLRTVVWNRWFRGVEFACLPCQMRTLGHPIGPRELRDCLMNEWHPAFVDHGYR